MPLAKVLPVLVSTMLLAGCAAPSAVPAASPGLPDVLAAETFLADIAQNVAGKRLMVSALLPQGVDPHEFQPAPQDAIKIAQSEVLIVNGLGYETWLQKSLPDAEGGERLVVVASDGLIPTASGARPGADPHLWVDPLNVIRYTENIRDGLSKADPAGAAAYSANALAYTAKLRELDQWIRDEIGQIPPARRLLVTNHDELRYFAEEYGFVLTGAVIPSVTSEASPSPQEMASLIQSIKLSGAPAIFLDVSENRQLANQIAAESGAKVITGLYIETLSSAGGPAPTYIDMMKYDVTLMVKALE